MKSILISVVALAVSLAVGGYVIFDAVTTENGEEVESGEWPEVMQDVYLAYCQGEQGHTADQCRCVLEKLQGQLSFADYMALGLVAWSVELDSSDKGAERESLEGFLEPIKAKCGVDLLGESPTPTPDPLEGYEFQSEHDGAVRLYAEDKAYGVLNFPVLQNSCDWNRYEVEWRTVDGSSIQVYAGGWIHSQAEYSQGVPLAELGDILQWDSQGSLVLWGCSQPLFSGHGITDVVVRYSVYEATP